MHIHGKAASCAVVLVLAASGAAAQTLNGPEFRVNNYTGFQYGAEAAVDPNGHFVVVWGGAGAGDLDGVFARRYRSSGVPLGPEFRVNTETLYEQYVPSVGVDAAGKFVVVWQSHYADGDGYAVLGQRFDAVGLPLGDEFQINTYTTGYQWWPSVAVNGDGSFVVVWESDYQDDGIFTAIVGRRYDNSGAPVGSEFVVNTYTTHYQLEPRVRFGAGGAFVVVWDGYGPGDVQGIFARRYDAGGTPIGAEFLVNTTTANVQAFTTVGTDPNGRFVIAWEDYFLAGDLRDSNGIFARRYNSAGVAVGEEFAVNTYTPGEQLRPSVAVDSSGGFTVAWFNSPVGDGSGTSVQARQFSSSGVALGSDFRVNTYTTGNQSNPNVVAGGPGDFLVLWEGGGPQDGDGVFGQRYGDLVFADGFNWNLGGP